MISYLHWFSWYWYHLYALLHSFISLFTVSSVIPVLYPLSSTSYPNVRPPFSFTPFFVYIFAHALVRTLSFFMQRLLTRLAPDFMINHPHLSLINVSHLIAPTTPYVTLTLTVHTVTLHPSIINRNSATHLCLSASARPPHCPRRLPSPGLRSRACVPVGAHIPVTSPQASQSATWDSLMHWPSNICYYCYS